MTGRFIDEDPRAFDFSMALQIALTVHTRQKDKGGEPYILHPIRVAMKMKSPMLQCVAVLHDALEDAGDFQRETLAATIQTYFGFGFLALVKSVTRGEEPYETYIRRLSENPVSRKVKLADLDDNLDPVRWQRTGYTPPTAQQVRYEWARWWLKNLDLQCGDMSATLCKSALSEELDFKGDQQVAK